MKAIHQKIRKRRNGSRFGLTIPEAGFNLRRGSNMVGPT